MKIGVDISPLQGPHRMRGIGYVAANFLKNLPASNRDSFVFYAEKNESVTLDDLADELSLKNIKSYEIRPLPARVHIKDFPGKLKYITKALRKVQELIDYSLGVKIENVKDIDAFLQLDQSAPLPRLKRKAHRYFIAYDVIPYALESDYLWNFNTARRNGLSRKAALKCLIRRSLYILKLRLNSRKATRVIAISETTKSDFHKYVGTSMRKLVSVTLGLSVVNHESSNHDGRVMRYYDTSWGYLPKPVILRGKFLLFVGGADHRRKLDDLVAAFNHLRGESIDIQLVLSGDSMQGPRNIATHSIQKALINSSYGDDIIYVGFSDDITRDWLYENAVAFIFPSVYEGFGLPVLEAMSYGTPVICYKNKAVTEVASSIPFYAEDALDIKRLVVEILDTPKGILDERLAKGVKQAKKYHWSRASTEILGHVTGRTN
jgi:glycosyltransferase involved in cell wall biosynthesis